MSKIKSPAKSAKAPAKPAKPEKKGKAAPTKVKGIVQFLSKKVVPALTAGKPAKAASLDAAPAKKNQKPEPKVAKKAEAPKKGAAAPKMPKVEETKASKRAAGRAAAAEAAAASVCREVACELTMTTKGYCRLHYIKNWKKIQRKEMILKERKLNHYIEELVSKYPDKYIEAIRQDLASEKDFAKVIADLEIEENLDDFEVETESAEGLIDNIKRDFEDDGDVF